MLSITLQAATTALLAGGAVALALFCVWPALRQRRAHRIAYLLTGLIAAAVPIGLVLASVVPIPSLLIPILFGVLLVAWARPDLLARATGGSRPLQPDVAAALDRGHAIWAKLDVGNVDGAISEAEFLDERRTPTTDHYVELWKRFISEEQARRSGSAISAWTTLWEIRQETARLSAGGDDRTSPWAWAIVALAALLGASSSLIDDRACLGTELLLATANAEVGEGPTALAESLMYFNEPGAPMIRDEPLSLEAAAASRHDPDTYRQLAEAGFVGAHTRAWRALDGRQISADVFEFRDAEGAWEYHRAVNRHACQYSNEAFTGDDGGVGLQVRYSNPLYPIVEQVSWVSGARRFVVSVDALEPSASHARVLWLAVQQMEFLGK